MTGIRSPLIASILLSFIFASASFAQVNEEPVLLEEWADLDCESLLSRTDNLFLEVSQRPNWHGVVVILGDTSTLSRNLVYEAWIWGNVHVRGFSAGRLKVVRRLSKEAKLQFWVVPSGGNDEFAPGEEWTLIVPTSVRPFVFWETEEGSCPGQGSFAQLLKANPNARGNIVLRGTSREIRKEKKELIADLVDSLKVPRKRLKFFPVIKRKSWGFADVEFWFLP